VDKALLVMSAPEGLCLHTEKSSSNGTLGQRTWAILKPWDLENWSYGDPNNRINIKDLFFLAF